MPFLCRLLRDPSGATAIEYGLIAALISVGLAATFSQIGHTLQNSFQAAATAFGG